MQPIEIKTGAVLMPGSYDPITRGHLDVITRAAALFAQVYVAVMDNDMTRYVAQGDPVAKEKSYRFTRAQREQMAALACAHLPHVTVLSDGGRLIDLAARLGVTLVVKGVRDSQDFVYEQRHALWNRTHEPAVETVYLPADPQWAEVSATRVRLALEQGRDVSPWVPEVILPWLREETGRTAR